MFENLAGNVLSKILSKYFTEESLAKNKATKTAHLGIWSGYISLEDLEVKTNIINEKLRRKGHPLDLVHCSLRQIEITIPWAKYGTNGLSRSNSSKEAVAVLVLDGVHALFRTSFSFFDDDLRAEEIKKRREALSRSEIFAKSSPDADEDFSFEESKTYTEILKKRITSGILREILDKLHIHIRDFHVRIEDIESDPQNPCAFGVTMESMHVQDGNNDGIGIDQAPDESAVSKVAQINHFAVYWNALDYGDDLPVENSVLHETCANDMAKTSQALDFCIVRRGSPIASPSRRPYIPTHTFLVLPFGGQLYFWLSNDPKDLSSRPAVEMDIELDCISTNLRDFQCIQMLRLYKERKNFQFVKKYRKFRPKESVVDDPRAWWFYAARIIKFELKDNFLRWSLSRFERKYAIRARYMSLYERRIRYSSKVTNSSSPVDTADDFNSTLDAIETAEIQELEDGIHGDLSVTDIILYRAIVNMRMGKDSNPIIYDVSKAKRRSSWWTETVQDATVDDVEATEEFDRLLKYLDKVPENNDTSRPQVRNDSLIAISVTIHVEEVRFVLFSPLYITAEETQLKRLHEKFLEFISQGTRMRGTLRGDYKNFGLEFSVVDFTASEVRMDKSQHLVASQLKREIISLDATVDQKMYEQDLLLFFTFTKNPVNNPGVNKELRMVLRPLEINMNLDCQWIGHLKGFMREVTTAPNVEKFWGELSLAYLNSLTLGKLALMAKAESAASGHENLDVDVAMHCPVLRIGIGDDADLLIDLGILSLRTDRLAGISRNKLKKRPLIQNGSAEDDFAPLGLRQMSIDDGSLNGGSLNGGSRSSRVPSSVFRKPIRNLMFSSAVSLESIHASERTNRSFDGSLNLDDAFPAIDRGSERKNSQNESRIEELFYDKYQLRLQTGKISFSGESEVFDISSGFELRTTIQKSIIPTDHTLCKLKAHTVVESIKLVLNEDLVSRFAVGYTMWKSLMKADVASQTYRRAVTKSLVSKDEVGRFIPNDDQVKYEYDSSSSETASEIDECEFFDAKEGAESVGGENTSGVWFEDHWIADAESVIDAGSRGSSNDRRFHRRQPSLSDVSSVSDHSKNRRSQLENGYLSAENLARLEEVGEDDSVAESGKEMDDDSFHSVMSAGGQAQLLTDLEESAKELEAKIEHLSAIMEENADTLVDINDPELPQRRNIHKKTKRDIHRSKAELKALNAVCQDLQILLSDKGNNLAPELDKEEFAVVTIQQARTAKALIHAKQRNDSDESHRLVRHLNRELFKGSILLSELQITLRTGDHSSDVKHDGKISDFEFFASQVALALFHYANDTKVYFSLDQVAMSVTNVVDVHAVKPSLIFSGGSSDTPLPVRLPHLVAHSMEDRFIRGVMAIRKHRSSESSRRLAKSCKIRLVVGDVEMSPSHKSITLMLQSLVRVKAAMTSSESCIQIRDTPEPEEKQTEQLQRSHHYFDLALRLTSVRIVLTHEDKVTGAVVASESSLRLLLLASQIRNKFQGDFRCANAQLLDILSFENIETCRGSEILGRRDPYNFLFQLRLRSQLVPSDERSGWVVGVHTPDSDNKRGTCDVRNTHLGIKISPLSILASPDAFTKLSKSLCEIRQVFQKPRDLSKNQKKVSFIERIARQARLRWRFDLVLRRINIRFPDENKSEWNISDDIGTKMVVAFTTVLSVQESNIESGRISIRMGITDISMIRSMDDWPILEPFTMIFELTLMSNFVSRLSEESRVDILPLLVMAGSPLNEIDVIMTRYGWGSIPSRECNDEKSTLVLKFSPLKINISVCIIAFINGILQSFKTNPSRKQEKKLEPNPTMSLLPSAKNMMGRNKFGLQVSFEDAEIQLLRANESKPIAYASRLISFTMTDVTVDYSQGEEVSASILIRDSALFDLSSGKGIRVIGEDPEARLGFPYFVRIKLYMHLEGVQTIRLHINWGKIQCLVLPSFFRSILDLKEGLKSLNGTNRASGETRGRKVNPYIRFLHHPNDINLILSADAETFECILASRDIIEYVKNGDKDPFGVVTFRWKASLSLAMALDCLKDSSVPWLTLNFDGIFTDEEDVDLFKDFSNNYLGNSSGLPVENAGYKLANAFSTKVNYKLSAFQVLRTNITLMELFNPSQKGFTVMPRICFKISQPIAGEQRITNPIDLVLVYKATGASIANRADDEFSEYEVKLAQLLLLEANFVDVLVYMGSKRLGGFSDSFSVSVKPILDMAKRKDTKRISQDNGISVPTDISSRFLKTPKLSDILKSSPSICRVQIEGFLITCVPGGASRLNESPIIKFELSNILSGIAAVPVNLNLGMVPGKGTSEEDNSQRQYIAGSEMMNANVGGWIAFQITGHYHNRRLVAWEPFIEPWIADISFGIDLVEACRWEPTIKQEATITRTATESSLTEVSGVETPGTGKDRLREIGRLIRSPFQSLQSSTSSRKGSPDISHSDLCYLMLSSSARSILSSALYNSSGSQSDVESKIFNTMPSTSPIEWLQGFGKPTKTSSTRDDHGPFSISVILSDKMPLNVNLTGALIENVMGYLDNTKKTGSKAIVPHVIRNASGMTLRFREVLGTDRTKRKEKSAKIILADGSETPLTLKRSLSQTCDPHRAFIYLELGSFEDTVGRISNGDFAIPKGERSANFSFKASAKIPVDAVGVHRYPLDRNVNSRGDTNDDGSNSRALGWIIVRVALRGSVKVVSIESPFVLKNAADADLLCEVRDESGISLLWRCLVPKEECTDSNWKQDGVVSIPADIVPFIHDGSYRFSVTAISRSASFLHEADLTAIQYNAVEISTPPPFSPKSFGRGLVGEEEVILPALVSLGNNHSEGNESFESDEKVHVTACAVRIGSASFSQVDSSIEVPEQRMIFFRSPLVIRNFLALPIAVQVRVKTISNASMNNNMNSSGRGHTLGSTGWEDLGVLDCGESVPWTGSPSSDQVELRVKFVGTDGDNSRRYPGWSSPVHVPARDNGNGSIGQYNNPRSYAKMKMSDADDVVLNLSVAFEFGNDTSGIEQSECESIRHYCQKFPSATRSACIFVPYWIIDGTHQDLEFFAGSPVAGQLDRSDRIDDEEERRQKFGNTLGLAELMDNQNFLNASSGSGFDVLMIGDENAPRLTVRKRLSRNERLLMQGNASPWSDSIPLQVGRKATYDLTVLTPDEITSTFKSKGDDGQNLDRIILRSSIVNANNRFGGKLGTKLIHIVNRYSISNETGRDIEIAANAGSTTTLVVRATTSPQPFHFDDSREIRFRFKEFGWAWSGRFKIRLNRREVTMRIRHKMKGQTIIITVEVRSSKKSATNLIVFRESSHPPFRLENHTMYPLRFGQVLLGIGSEENDCDSLLLQYQTEDFAWDEPEISRRALLLQASGSIDNPRDIVFGKFQLDKIAPGTVLQLDSDLFTGEVVADGPTRVLRVSDASMPRISSARQGEFDYFRSAPEVLKPLTTSFSINMSQGIGISVVDFSPKELLYICLEDIELNRKKDGKKDDVRFSIGSIKLNNQLWVTPYPVFLKMGHRHTGKANIRRKNRRHNAISILWQSSLNTHGGYGNLTLLDWIEVSSEPIFANVDGELAGLLVRMARQVASISSSGEDGSAFQSRDEELKSLLTSSGVGEYSEDSVVSSRTHHSLQDDASQEPLTTAAIAAKLRDSPAYVQQSTPRSGHYLIENASRKRKKQPLMSKAQHKFYIERLKISTTRADLSWSGVLPGLLSSSLFKALTFERLPMRLRPFSNSHAYGNVEDHLQILRSHYMSIWRVVDVFMGLSANPTFLFRGVFHTFREGYASILDSWALCLRYYSTQLTKLLQPDYKLVPSYDDGNPVQYTENRSDFLKTISSPFVNGLAFVFNNISMMISLISSQMKYSPKSSSARHTRGLVRSRNPRLFAHLDGKDLLVEYVEGENAGKALLSRVRSGLHLGEGYFYHAEGVRQLKSYFRSRGDIDSAPLILMITLERILLLTGKLDQHFCSVRWEAYSTNIIHIDLLPSDVLGEESAFPYDEIIVWHLSDPEFSGGNKIDKAHKYAKNLVSGIDVLHSKSIFVPRRLGEQVLEKLKLFESRS